MWEIASLVLLGAFVVWMIWMSERYNAKHKRNR